MFSGIISLVLADRGALAGLLDLGRKHGFGSLALGSAGGVGDGAAHRQPIAVLHQRVAHVA